MKLKALAVALSLVVAGSACAATPVVSVTANGNINFKSTPILVGGGNFSDSFTFSLPDLYDKTSGGVTTKMNGLTKDVDFTSIVITKGAQSWAFVQTGWDDLGKKTEQWALKDVILSSGALYTLTLNGHTTGNALYSGNLAFTSTPVPEPETYGMLLAGLGLVGLLARRKAR